jgi:hypothetical protein
MLGAGLIEALLLARALPGERVIWPLRMAGVCSFITLFAHVAWPLPGRACGVLLALRAALPLAAAVTGAPLWLHTSPAGVAMQVAACALMAAHAAWRERTLRPEYERQLRRLKAKHE